MKPFAYERAATVEQAAQASADPCTRLLAGGTNLLDLMKLQIETPSQIVDISRLPLTGIEPTPAGGLRIGALATNTAVASDAAVRSAYPVLSRAILSGASPQLRNKATMAGNLMQRNRCAYFYDPAKPCNRRVAGSGCSAIGGLTRSHAVLGGSDACIAVNPSDMAVALSVLEAVVETTNGDGVAVDDLHRMPGDTPHIETTLMPGEMITAVELPPPPPGPQSYRKVRDRASYAGAQASLAVAGDRMALGGVATIPWRAHVTEAARRDGASAKDAAAAELAPAKVHGANGFKIALAQRLLVEAMTGEPS